MREITPQPGHTVEEVEDALASGQFVFSDCFTLLPLTGDPLRYTNYQRDVSVVPIGEVVGRTYEGNRVLIKGLRVKCSIGIDVDEQQLEIDYPDDPTIFQGSLSLAKALLLGRMDGATIRRDRYISSGHGQPWLGGFPMFSGLVSNLTTVGRQSATMNVKSSLILMNVQMPRDLWEANCKNTWGDPICGVNQNDYAVVGAVGPAPTRSYLPWSSSSTEYALGKIFISNGDSTTRVRTISRADASGLYLSYPLDFDPVEGMEFTAFPGCNRTKERCPTFHPSDWQQFFKGFPFVPVAETAIGG